MDLNSLTAVELAEHFKVSERAVQQWAEAGMPYTPIKGKVYRYCWTDCFTWWLANRYKGPVAPARGSKVPTKAESEARILNTKAEREQMKLERDRGLLVPTEEIAAEWLRVGEIIKNRVLTLAPKAREAIPYLTAEDGKVLHRLCREALEELSQCLQSEE